MTQTNQELKYLCVLDFEATCWDRSDDHEIIEFPSIIIDLETNKIIDTFQVFVKPKITPVISEFCHSLTGITQEQIDNGISFIDAVKQHEKFVSKYCPSILCTDGDWDFRNMFPKDCNTNSIKPSKYYTKWINIKRAFEKLYGVDKSGGIPQMCKYLNITMEGRLHSGIDDCKNIANIIIQMLKDGWIPELSTRIY